MDIQDPVTAKKLKALPVWWQVAFAARCLKLAMIHAPTVGKTHARTPAVLEVILIVERLALCPPVVTADRGGMFETQLRIPRSIRDSLNVLRRVNLDSARLICRAEDTCREADVCEARATAEPNDRDYAERAVGARNMADSLSADAQKARTQREDAFRVSNELMVDWLQPRVDELQAAADEAIQYLRGELAMQLNNFAPEGDEFDLLARVVLDQSERSARHRGTPPPPSESPLPRNWAELRSQAPQVSVVDIASIALRLSAFMVAKAAVRAMNEPIVADGNDLLSEEVSPSVISSSRFALLSQTTEQGVRNLWESMQGEFGNLKSKAPRRHEQSGVPMDWLLGPSPAPTNGAPIEAPSAAVPAAHAPPEHDWEAVNGRRLALIQKQFRGGGLTPDEDAELNRLQAFADRYLDQAHPLPLLTPEERALLTALVRK